MNPQQPLFFDDVQDALRVAVQALGGLKPVGCRLWPEKAPDAAGRHLSDCLNTAKAEKLSPEQFLLIGKWAREAGCHAVASYYGQECGYEFKPIDPGLERDRLADALQEASRNFERLTAAVNRLPKDRAV